jgi:hypothetical protein
MELGSAYAVGMPGKAPSGGVDILGLVYLALVLAVIFLPMVLGRPGPPPGGSDSDSDDGGGNGPWPPPSPSNTPGGGIPLEDSQPARARLRGHERLFDLLPIRTRRRSREPHRTPVQR